VSINIQPIVGYASFIGYNNIPPIKNIFTSALQGINSNSNPIKVNRLGDSVYLDISAKGKIKSKNIESQDSKNNNTENSLKSEGLKDMKALVSQRENNINVSQNKGQETRNQIIQEAAYGVLKQANLNHNNIFNLL